MRNMILGNNKHKQSITNKFPVISSELKVNLFTELIKKIFDRNNNNNLNSKPTENLRLLLSLHANQIITKKTSIKSTCTYSCNC